MTPKSRGQNTKKPKIKKKEKRKKAGSATKAHFPPKSFRGRAVPRLPQSHTAVFPMSMSNIRRGRHESQRESR
jgi:hypothetical protein